jgi:TPR repeat protein
MATSAAMEMSISELESAANSDNVKAQVVLGIRLLTGLGVTQDESAAAIWLRGLPSKATRGRSATSGTVF